jgi:Protein of unknown function (DUF2924)/S1/P1 Nuclease
VALKFPLHFVSDLHQPLHSSDDNDHGGNLKRVSAAGFKAGKDLAILPAATNGRGTAASILVAIPATLPTAPRPISMRRGQRSRAHGRPYKSLSSVARQITGTKWNGWVFFGLKNQQGRK